MNGRIEWASHLSVRTIEINENQPLGTILGKLQILGESGMTISKNPTFQLLEIEGDNNLLNRRSVGPALVLERDGSLKTGRVLDFEIKPSYVLRMRITDEDGLFMETSVEVKIIDQYRPIVKTLDGMGDKKGFDPYVKVDEIPLSKQSSIIEAGTSIAQLKGFVADGEELSVPHEFVLLDSKDDFSQSAGTSTGDWISFTPRLNEIEVNSGLDNKPISLFLDNLNVDKEKAPTWLMGSRGAVWFALIKRSFGGKVEELFSGFDSNYMLGIITSFPMTAKIISRNRFIAFPADLIRREMGVIGFLINQPNQIITTSALKDWLGQDQLDLAVYVEDVSVELKRTFEKRFPMVPLVEQQIMKMSLLMLPYLL